jgi:hypothetical protein
LSAMDKAGKICPPVPPPLMIARIFLYFIRTLVSQTAY